MTRKLILTLCFLTTGLIKLWSQNEDFNSMMYSAGKLNTVVGVIVIIFIGIVIYLIAIDRRLRKIENQK